MAPADLEALIATRRALHVVAEHVLMPDLHDWTGHIGLRPSPGGFATQPYAHRGGATRRLRVEGTEVVDERDDVVVTRVPLTDPVTLGELRAALGITGSAPGDIYDLGSDGSPHQVLVLDPDSTALVADLFAVAQAALTALLNEAQSEPDRPVGDDGVGVIQLWPEHLDLSCSLDEVTYGASPGDDDHPEPFLYASPWAPAPELTPAAPAARRPARPVPSIEDALAWYRQVRATAR